MGFLLIAATSLELLMPQPQCVCAREGSVRHGAPVVVVRGAIPDAPVEAADESYVLELASTGVTITASSDVGERYARVTLEQLKKLSHEIPCCRIVDWPSSRRRVLACDCDSSDCTAHALRLRIDAMALYKMNVLQLARVGRDELPELSAYARKRGVSVETDISPVSSFHAPANPCDLLSHLAFGSHAEVGVNLPLPALVGFAERQWTGRAQNRPEFLGRLPLPGTPAFAVAEALERRLIAQRDCVLTEIGLPFPFIGQTRMRWRVSNQKTGAMCVTDVPQATIWAYDERMPENALAFVGGPNDGVVFETWIRSPGVEERSVACWVGCLKATDGETDVRGEVRVNGRPLELRTKPTVVDVRFRPGLNHIAVILPPSDESTRRSCGMIFCPFWGPASQPREVTDVEFSATPPLHAFEQRWGTNRLWGKAQHGRTFRDIPIAQDHRYVIVTKPMTDGVVRLVDARRNEYRRYRLSDCRHILPSPGATAAEILLEGEADVIVWEMPESPVIPAPYPDAVAYDDMPTDEPTDRFQLAIDRVAVQGGGVVRVPAGVWHVKPLQLRSNVTLELSEGSVLLASLNPDDYPPEQMRRSFILAEDATNVTIRGKGILDGRGWAFRETRRLKAEGQPVSLPRLLKFNRCAHVRLEDFTYRRSGSWGCHLCDCDGVVMRRVHCFNHVNITNDGVDIESRNVLIEDCDIDADDDALVIKAETDKRFAVTNIVVRNCRLASMAYPFKIGTGSYTDIRDVRVENCDFTRTKVSWRFPWSKSSIGVTNDLSGICGIGLQCVDGGRLENVTVRNVRMEGYGVPIAIRLGRRHAPNDPRGTYLRNVLIENVRAIAEGPTASSVCGVPGLEPENILFRNVHLILTGGGTEADALSYVFENEKGYPGPCMFKSVLPASGIYTRHARNVCLENVTFETRTPDSRPFVLQEDESNNSPAQAAFVL